MGGPAPRHQLWAVCSVEVGQQPWVPGARSGRLSQRQRNWYIEYWTVLCITIIHVINNIPAVLSHAYISLIITIWISIHVQNVQRAMLAMSLPEEAPCTSSVPGAPMSSAAAVESPSRRERWVCTYVGYCIIFIEFQYIGTWLKWSPMTQKLMAAIIKVATLKWCVV